MRSLRTADGRTKYLRTIIRRAPILNELNHLIQTKRPTASRTNTMRDRQRQQPVNDIRRNTMERNEKKSRILTHAIGSHYLFLFLHCFFGHTLETPNA